jgi:hypothetical protein
MTTKSGHSQTGETMPNRTQLINTAAAIGHQGSGTSSPFARSWHRSIASADQNDLMISLE